MLTASFSAFFLLPAGLSQDLSTDDGGANYHHELSFQSNRILREMISLSSSGTSNPFVFRYNYLFDEQHALTLGMGLTFERDQFKEWDQERSLRNHLDLRLGYQRRLDLGHGMQLGLGWDAVFGLDRFRNGVIDVENASGSPGDSAIYKSKSHYYSYGTGPRITFNYQITSRIAVGTEVSFYYYFLQGEKSSTSFTHYTHDGDGYEVEFHEAESQHTRRSYFQTEVPSAIYLILRL